jgi:hypothetical protein
MADRAYFVPRRNDLDGMNMQVTDLRPNTSDRNFIYDGPGQSGYLKYSMDQPGATVVLGDSYCSGSLTTSPVAALVDDDTTGGGDDVAVAGVAQFGLLAYIQDRVQPGGVASAAAIPATPTQALDMADAILALVEAGSALTLVSVNAALSGVVASTDLDGAAVNSLSFGTVGELLQILTGESYRLRAAGIVGVNGGGAFLDLAARQVLVAAQDTVANGGTTFTASGGFLVRGEPGFRDFRPILISEYVRISARDGVLAGYADPGFDYLNPAFDYLGTATSLPRATDLAGNNLPATGIHAVVAVYDQLGNVVN